MLNDSSGDSVLGSGMTSKGPTCTGTIRALPQLGRGRTIRCVHFSNVVFLQPMKTRNPGNQYWSRKNRAWSSPDTGRATNPTN